MSFEIDFESSSFDFAELADRIEASPGPDRTLDIIIGCAINLTVDGSMVPFREVALRFGLKETLDLVQSHNSVLRTALPRYTESVDAAITLIPVGYAIERVSAWPGELADVSVVGTKLRPFGNDRKITLCHSAEDGDWRSRAATLALALCASALRSRS
jgi:hypothetical protein